MIRAFLSITFCILSLSNFAQDSLKVEVVEAAYDTSYVKVFAKYISIENSIARNGLNVLIQETKGSNIRYSINQKFQLGYRINWRYINLGFAINLPILNNDDDKYGKTSGFYLNFTSQIKRRLILDIYFLQQKGMFAANAPSLIPNFDRNGNYPTFESMVVDHIGIDGNYIFNHEKFSFKAPLNINERQLKSSGSLFIGGYFFFSQIINESGLLTDSIATNFKYLLNTTKMNSFNFGFTAGYGHNFVIKKHGLISTTGYIGFGPGFSNKVESNDIRSNKVVLSGRYKVRLIAAYMNDQLSVGARFLAGILPNSANERNRIFYETDYAAFFFSYRFLPLMSKNKAQK